MNAHEIERRLQSLINDLRAEVGPPTRAEYERACAEWFDYQALPFEEWKVHRSIELEVRANTLRKELNTRYANGGPEVCIEPLKPVKPSAESSGDGEPRSSVLSSASPPRVQSEGGT